MDYFTGPIAIISFFAGFLIQAIACIIQIGEGDDTEEYFDSFGSKLTPALGIVIAMFSIISTPMLFDILNIESKLLFMFLFGWVSVLHIFNARIADFLFCGKIFRFMPDRFSKIFPAIMQIHYIMVQVWIFVTVLTS